MAVYRLTLKGKLFGQSIQNVLHFKEKTPGAMNRITFANEFNNAWVQSIRNWCIQSMQWTEIYFVDISNPDDVPTVLPINVAGGVGGNAQVAPHLTVVYKLKTGVGGRRGRGRFHISGVQGGHLLEGVWTPSLLVQLNSIATTLKQNFTGENPFKLHNLGVMPRTDNPNDFLPVTDIIVRNYPGSQRRRNFLVGA